MIFDKDRNLEFGYPGLVMCNSTKIFLSPKVWSPFGTEFELTDSPLLFEGLS